MSSHTDRGFENRALRRIFGRKRGEDSVGCRYDKELHNLYASPNIRMIQSRTVRWAGHVSRMEEMINAHSILVGKPEGKRPLGRPRRRWENSIGMDLKGNRVGGCWTGCIWLRIGTNGVLL
jgi:hypothetical protein